MTRTVLILSAALSLLTVGCDHGHEAHAEPHAEAHGEAAHGHSHEPDAAAGDLDLVEVMRGLEANMQQLEFGLWRDDLPAVQRGAEAIANHPHIGPTELARVQSVLGDDFSSFIAADKVTHGAAVTLAKAAAESRKADVVSGLATLQSSCVACHDSLRARMRKPVPAGH